MQDTQYGLKVTISVPYELAVQRATALKTEGLPVTRRKTRPWPMRPNERGATMPTWSSLTQPERLTAATPFSFCAFVMVLRWGATDADRSIVEPVHFVMEQRVFIVASSSSRKRPIAGAPPTMRKWCSGPSPSRRSSGRA